jgi:hypothetical protein
MGWEEKMVYTIWAWFLKPRKSQEKTLNPKYGNPGKTK